MFGEKGLMEGGMSSGLYSFYYFIQINIGSRDFWNEKRFLKWNTR